MLDPLDHRILVLGHGLLPGSSAETTNVLDLGGTEHHAFHSRGIFL